MKNIMNYEEFVNEGLISALKAKSQITKVQGAVLDKAYLLFTKQQKKYDTYKDGWKDAEKILNGLETDAKNLFEKTVTAKDAIDKDQWWKEFLPKAVKSVAFICIDDEDDDDDIGA